MPSLLAVAAGALLSAAGAHPQTVQLPAPPQGDAELARIWAPRARLRAALAGPTGLDWLAAAQRGRGELLVAASNRRPPGSLAPDIARLLLRIRGTARRPRVRITLRVLGAGHIAPAGFCSGPVGPLRAEVASGAAPGGLPPARLIAGLYRIACGQGDDAVVRGAVAGAAFACPPNAICAPLKCPPCVSGGPPRAGAAANLCPLIACPAPVGANARQAASR